MNIDGTWLGDERVINGVGRVSPGPVSMPANLAENFERQGLFKVSRKSTAKKEASDNVRTDD